MEKEVKTPRKIFTVIIHNKEFDVYDIEGKEHEGYNDTPKTWWLYYSDRLPDGLTPPPDSESWERYCVGTLRRLWEIKIKQTNSTKEKWGETQFRNHTSVEMWCNNKLIYQFGTGGKYLDFAFAKIQYLQVLLGEHPYNFFEPETEVGRKICWYGLPATILTGYGAGEIRIKPDYTAGLEKEEWWKELERREHKYTNKDDFDKQMDDIDEDDKKERIDNDIINWGDALSDGNIYWFRK
jgi:hypothetical protein